jgi:hypothetical protein
MNGFDQPYTYRTGAAPNVAGPRTLRAAKVDMLGPPEEAAPRIEEAAAAAAPAPPAAAATLEVLPVGVGALAVTTGATCSMLC